MSKDWVETSVVAYAAVLYGIPHKPVEPVILPDYPGIPPALVLSPEDRALLQRIEAKLDELLQRTAPEASVVEEIRKRVNDALDKLKRK